MLKLLLCRNIYFLQCDTEQWIYYAWVNGATFAMQDAKAIAQKMNDEIELATEKK